LKYEIENEIERELEVFGRRGPHSKRRKMLNENGCRIFEKFNVQ
jgi:hypothetical protein